MNLDTSTGTQEAAPVTGPQPPALAALLSGLAAVAMWGLAPVATRAAVIELAPLPLATIRALTAGLVLLPWSLPVLRRLDRGGIARATGAGLLGMVGYNLPVALGVQWLPASTAALVLATEPIWIMVLGRALLREHASRRSWIGSGAALTGVAAIAGPGLLHTGHDAHILAGLGLVLLGTLLFAAYTIALRPLSTAYGSRTATAASTTLGAIPYLTLAGTVKPHQLLALPATAWSELAFLAVGTTVVGMLLWNLSVARIGSTRAGLLLFAEPVVGVTGGLVLLGERLSVGVIAGGALVMAGLATAWTGQRHAGQA